MKKFVSYAQNYEDVMLYRALGSIKNGCYIDIGAEDPVELSVTKNFYDIGWRGINVEPIAEFHARFEKQRPDEFNLNCAVSDDIGKQTLFVIPNTGLSTLEEEVANKHITSGYEVQKKEVPVVTLSWIVENCVEHEVQFLKIDAEGAESRILSGGDFNQFRPWIVVIEATEPMSSRLCNSHVDAYLSEHNYECVYFDGLNKFYLASEHCDLKSAFDSPPNYFDQFVSFQELKYRQRCEELSGKAEELVAVQNELAQVYASRSWGMTAPLRRFERHVRALFRKVKGHRLRLRQASDIPRNLVFSMLRLIARYPRLKKMGKAMIRTVPPIERRLRKLWAYQAYPSTKIHSQHKEWNKVWGFGKGPRKGHPPSSIPEGLLMEAPELLCEDDGLDISGASEIRSIKAIHQFSHGAAYGDGITRSMQFTRRLLRELGFTSEIYCRHVPDELRSELYPMRHFVDSDETALIIHHSMEHDNQQWIERCTTSLILVYHNITRLEYSDTDGTLQYCSRKSRDQLSDWKGRFAGAVAVSPYSCDDLRSCGYDRPASIPLLVDLDEIVRSPRDEKTVEFLRTLGTNILFVGRVVENKCQHELIKVLHQLRSYYPTPVHLHLVGSVTSDEYINQLHSVVDKLDLSSFVHFPGNVSGEVVAAYYQEADIFLCLSDHEESGISLIEAMAFDTPVIAYGAGAVPYTLGESGFLVSRRDPDDLAQLLAVVLSYPARRAEVIEGQRKNLQRFEPAVVKRQFKAFIARLGIHVPKLEDSCDERPTFQNVDWRVDGPFDSSYSLALLNRETARALSLLGNDVVLHATEGPGDYKPDPQFLRVNSDIADMYQRGKQPGVRPRVVTRNVYPPRLTGMKGELNILHSYAWEETGFPQEWIAEFNKKLNGVACLSQHVQKILIDSGLSVPAVVSGCGVDHWRRVQCATDYSIKAKSFRFLHVSSCFPRKGVDVLLNAYGNAFRREDDVTLIIKTFPNPHNDVATQLSASQKHDDNFPDVVLIEEEMSDSELKALYEQCHAFVAPARAEGFGLPLAEAMISGLPVITTGWGGQCEFCDESTAWLVDYQFKRTESHFGLFDSVWAEPDPKHLASRMVEVVELGSEAIHERVDRAQCRLDSGFRWSQVAHRLSLSVKEFEETPSISKSCGIGWISTWNTRCGIASYSSYLVQNMSNDVTILAARTEMPIGWDASNVVRCWDSNANDRLVELQGEIRARDIGILVIQLNYGFFDFQVLSKFIEVQKKQGKTIVVVLHSTVDVELGGLVKRLEEIKDALGCCDRVLVHSVADLNRLKRIDLVDNVTLFPHGVIDIEPRAVPRPAPGSKIIIATYGFFLPHKGLLQVIDAIHQCVSNGKDIHLVMVNAEYPVPESRQSIEAAQRRISDLEMIDRVTMVTEFLPDEDSLGWLSHADIIVFPYQDTGESSSAAVRFGLAAGRPVVVTPLAIFDDVTGATLTLPGTRPEEIAAGLLKILDRHEDIEFERTQEVAEKWVEEHKYEFLADRLLRLLNALREQRADIDQIKARSCNV